MSSKNSGRRFGRREVRRDSAVLEAVLYARVSTPDQQREGYSIPAQVELIEDYANENGIRIVQRYTDVETARKAGRTAFGEMLRYLRKHPRVRSILVEKTDRLYRNIKDWATIDELGVAVHFVKENVVMSDDCRSSEKFVHGIKVLMAKAYIDNLGEESSKGMRQKAQQTRAPIGYLNTVDDSGRRVIACDPERAVLVSRLFDWFSTGEYSLKTVTAKARLAGLSYRKSGQPIAVATVHNILRNRIYTGAFDWLGVTYQGEHPAIVMTALWEAVQDILDRRSHEPVGSTVPEFVYRGLVKCGHCGCSLVAEIKKGRYIYYHCSGYRQKCPEPYVRQERLEEEFIALLAKLRMSDAAFEMLRAQLCGQSRMVDLGDPVVRASAIECAEAHDLTKQAIPLLSMARTAHTGFGALTPEVKRLILQLLLSRCTWAHGTLTGVFAKPFDLFAEVAAGASWRAVLTPETTSEISQLVMAIQSPDRTVKRLLARYDASLRLHQTHGPRANDERQGWRISAIAA